MGSTKNNLISFRALNNADLSANAASNYIDIKWLDNVSVQIQFGAGATGQFFVQGSNVPGNNNTSDNGPGTSDWVTIPFVDSTGAALNLTTSGSAGSYLVNADGLAFSFLRVIYTFTSGTGTGNAYVTAKGV